MITGSLDNRCKVMSRIVNYWILIHPQFQCILVFTLCLCWRTIWVIHNCFPTYSKHSFFFPVGLDSQYNTISSLGPFTDETGCISENIIVKKSLLTSTWLEPLTQSSWSSKNTEDGGSHNNMVQQFIEFVQCWNMAVKLHLHLKYWPIWIQHWVSN